MRSFALVSVLAAIGVNVASASTCTKDITITESTPTITCSVVSASVTVDPSVAGDLVISTVEEITGDFIVNNASQLNSLTSTTLTTIGGNFQMQSLELLDSLEMSALRSLNEITFIKLPLLSTLNFGASGVTKVNSIQISDTFISDLSGLSVATVENFEIDNNSKLTSFDSDLVNITGTLIITSNGNNMVITMDHLELASEIQISNVKSFSVPLLSQVTQSIKFDTNPELTSFVAPNLTTMTDDLSFINNVKLTNVSFPVLTTIDGGVTLQNNTLMETIDGFPELKSVAGAIILRGNFSKVEMPSLDDVRGSVTVTSTTDISDFCDFFDNLKKDGDIQGSESCTSNNAEANSGGDDGQSNSNSSSSSSKKDSAAVSSNANLGLLVVAVVFGLVHLF